MSTLANMRRSKIVCTLGPATSKADEIGQLIDAGMDVVRLNSSHGNHEDQLRTLEIVRAEAKKRDRAVAILLDLQGPKIRVGTFAEGSVELCAGDEFTITTDTSVIGDRHQVSTSYAGLPGDVEAGDEILLDDGYLALRVAAVGEREVKTVVQCGGVLRNRKGINLPNVAVSAPALTTKDRADLAFGLEIGVDCIALSFVRAPADVIQARELIAAGGYKIPLIAKIEKPQAVACLDDIIAVADGVMVARGDLGVELGTEKVPLVQKRMIEATNAAGKLVITATQMLESMIHNPRPTRAEVSDVANAVLDGTDALMLSGETAVGKYPIEAVRTMAQIITEIEESEHFRRTCSPPTLLSKNTATSIANAAVIAARQMEIEIIAVVTRSGGTARLMSEYRPEAPIIALTYDERTYRRLAMYWGVTPLRILPATTTDEMIERVLTTLRDRKLVESGQHVVITMSVPIDLPGATNMLEIRRVV